MGRFGHIENLRAVLVGAVLVHGPFWYRPKLTGVMDFCLCHDYTGCHPVELGCITYVSLIGFNLRQLKVPKWDELPHNRSRSMRNLLLTVQLFNGRDITGAGMPRDASTSGYHRCLATWCQHPQQWMIASAITFVVVTNNNYNNNN